MEQRLCNYCYSTGFHPRSSDGVFVYCTHCQKGRQSKGANQEVIDQAASNYALLSQEAIKKELMQDYSFTERHSDKCPYCLEKMTPFYKKVKEKIHPSPSLFCLNDECSMKDNENTLLKAGWVQKSVCE
jgi:hypothetical protein